VRKLLEVSTQLNYNMSLKFYANSNIMVIGASQSGKTTTVMRILKEKLITPMPKKIYYLYGAWQSFMDEWKEIKFVKGLDLSVIEDDSEDKILIIDDLMLDIDKDLAHHFIAGSSHKNTTTIFISHAIFVNNDLYRLISANCQYMLLFHNKRSYSQVSCLARQILGSDYKLLIEAYKSLGPYNFVLLSFHPLVPRELLILTNFWESPSVYL